MKHLVCFILVATTCYAHPMYFRPYYDYDDQYMSCPHYGQDWNPWTEMGRPTAIIIPLPRTMPFQIPMRRFVFSLHRGEGIGNTNPINSTNTEAPLETTTDEAKELSAVKDENLETATENRPTIEQGNPEDNEMSNDSSPPLPPTPENEDVAVAPETDVKPNEPIA